MATEMISMEANVDMNQVRVTLNEFIRQSEV